ncbi:MAG: hypothetical protein ACRCXZ_02665 [Patescibacteria group bacterium]
MTKKLITFLFIVFVSIQFLNFSSFAQEKPLMNEEDIKTIQNDAIVPRKTLFQSKEAINNINGERNYLNDLLSIDTSLANITKPIVAMRNLSFLLMVLFLIYQIFNTVIGKITLQDLCLGFVAGIIMMYGTAAAVFTIVQMTDYIGMFLGSLTNEGDFIGASVRKMFYFVSVDNQNIGVITREKVNTLTSIDPNQVTLSMEGFCLTTIQDQYRVFSLIFNWLFVILVYANWLILIIADIALQVCIFISPIIGGTYLLGVKHPLIAKYWTVLFQASVTKFFFFAVFFVVNIFDNNLSKYLINTGVNIEYALFSCALLVASLFAVNSLRKIAQVESGITHIVNKISKQNN